MTEFYTDKADKWVTIYAVDNDRLSSWLKKQSEKTIKWVKSCQFKPDPGATCLISNEQGELESVLLSVNDADDFWQIGALPALLPKHIYKLDNSDDFFDKEQLELAHLAWGLGSYQFNAYVNREPFGSQLFCTVDLKPLQQLTNSIFLIRDLINTPADDMGPEELTQAIYEVGEENKAKIKITKGEDLLEAGFTAIYSVGRAAKQAPRLVDLTWGDKSHPKITLVGKGVCFDSGGLDLKTPAGMRLMKKDMGGAAQALGLAQLIMQAQLPIRLRCLIPAVENAIDGKSYHPGDIIKTYGGYSVEIDNTDAEGRLVLCDAIALAMDDEPDYLFDFATLTGAGRVALGPEIAAMFCNNNEFSKAVINASKKVKDPMWRLPLHEPYRDMLKSELADMLNSSKVPMGGAITAALFLQTFVSKNRPWMHFDIMGYNPEPLPGRPVGGEAMTVRAVFEFLSNLN